MEKEEKERYIYNGFTETIKTTTDKDGNELCRETNIETNWLKKGEIDSNNTQQTDTPTKFKDKMILVFNLNVKDIDDEDVEKYVNIVYKNLMKDADDTVQIYVVPTREKVVKAIEVYNTTTDKQREFIEQLDNKIQTLIDLELEKRPELSKVLGIEGEEPSDLCDENCDCYNDYDEVDDNDDDEICCCPLCRIEELEQTNQELIEDNGELSTLLDFYRERTEYLEKQQATIIITEDGWSIDSKKGTILFPNNVIIIDERMCD